MRSTEPCGLLDLDCKTWTSTAAVSAQCDVDGADMSHATDWWGQNKTVLIPFTNKKLADINTTSGWMNSVKQNSVWLWFTPQAGIYRHSNGTANDSWLGENASGTTPFCFILFYWQEFTFLVSRRSLQQNCTLAAPNSEVQLPNQPLMINTKGNQWGDRDKRSESSCDWK